MHQHPGLEDEVRVRPLDREVVNQLRFSQLHPLECQHLRQPPIGATQPVANREACPEQSRRVLGPQPAFALDVNRVFRRDVQKMERLETGRRRYSVVSRCYQPCRCRSQGCCSLAPNPELVEGLPLCLYPNGCSPTQPPPRW